MQKLQGGLTVLMPVYTTNPNWLKTAVRSVLEQTYEDFDFIIVDDGSDITTKKILGEFARLDKRIRIVENSVNMGLTRSLNRGLRLCGTKWVARMDSDDVALPNRLEIQAAYLAEHPETSVLGTGAAYLESGRGFPFKHPPVRHEEIIAMLPFVCPFAHPSVVLNRDEVLAAGGYPDTQHAEDYALWLRLLLDHPSARFHIIPDTLLRYRRGLDRPLYRARQTESTELLQKDCFRRLVPNADPGAAEKIFLPKTRCQDVLSTLQLVSQIKTGVRKRFPEADPLFLSRGALRLKRQILASTQLSGHGTGCRRALMKSEYFLISSLIQVRRSFFALL